VPAPISPNDAGTLLSGGHRSPGNIARDPEQRSPFFRCGH
jgi:hypothetical protein